MGRKNDMDLNDLGKCLRDLRLTMGLSADELAKRCGISSGPTLTRLEQGAVGTPTFTTIYKLLDYLGKMDAIDEHKFDLDKYSHETIRIMNAFGRDDKPREYHNRKNMLMNVIDQNVDSISYDDLNAIAFYVNRKAEAQATSDILDNIENIALSYCQNVYDAVRPSVLVNMVARNGEEIADSIIALIEVKSPENMSKCLNTFLKYLTCSLNENINNSIAHT